jgi:hypothetical protein
LRYTPEEIGRFRLRDIYDTINGYNDEEVEGFKRIAELVRTATCILWNTQVVEEGRLDPDELWRFKWETEEAVAGPQMSAEEAKRLKENEEYQRKYLEDHF